MKRVACFCIPAHGHTNPMLPVVRELTRRGNEVRFYSFDEFEGRIRATGATFVSCDAFLPEVTARELERLKRVSTTEMTLEAIGTTRNMDDFLSGEFADFRPDVVYTDSVCFWGKLSAWKHGVPMVVSTSTFAFNQLSSQYMKYSPRELADMILGLSKISRALKALEPLGYHVKSALSLVQSDNDTDTVVYTSRDYQPYAESFSSHYLFAGPSVLPGTPPRKAKARPLIYISMGTVINDRPDFYARCVEALGDMEADVILSCGSAVDPKSLEPLPENFRVYPRVDQLEVLSRADVFITHCGMNSVSESLYMATPMLLYPQTGEQQAVARRALETGAGLTLKGDSAKDIRRGVETLLQDSAYAAAARARSEDFRACPGPAGAAAFIEGAPHEGRDPGVLAAMNLSNGKFQLLYWLVVAAAVVLFGLCFTWKYVWVIGAIAGMFSSRAVKATQRRRYQRVVAAKRDAGGGFVH